MELETANDPLGSVSLVDSDFPEPPAELDLPMVHICTEAPTHLMSRESIERILQQMELVDYAGPSTSIRDSMMQLLNPTGGVE